MEALAATIAVTALVHGLVVYPLLIWADHRWPDRGDDDDDYYNPYLDGV